MGKSSTTSQQSMPQFQQDYLRNTVIPFATSVSETPFQAYEGQRTPEMSGYTTQAGGLYGDIAGMGNMAPADYQSRINQNLAGFQGNVIDPTMAAMDRRFAQERVGDEAGLIGTGAFDSSRRAVFQGEREAARDIGMAQTIAGLQRQGYDAAAAQTMQQLGMQQGALGAGAAGMMSVGAGETALNAANLDAAYQEFMREQQDPYQQLGALTGGAGAIPGGYGSTTDTKRNGLFDYLTAAATVAASDPRLKDNVQHIATSNGIHYYHWTWNALAKALGLDTTPPTGVMADELQAIHPDLVHRGKDGYLRVDYAGLAECQAAAA